MIEQRPTNVALWRVMAAVLTGLVVVAVPAVFGAWRKPWHCVHLMPFGRSSAVAAVLIAVPVLLGRPDIQRSNVGEIDVGRLEGCHRHQGGWFVRLRSVTAGRTDARGSRQKMAPDSRSSSGSGISASSSSRSP
ncbi:hypothetical protein ABZ807_12580 [Micromonospora sp. NPDC047548]|uniref:hypothetical protein n=1 Tax=Micromonospora sp. NPDC047548 TaxID=3155624 RepID=UPI0033CCFAAC